MSTTAAAPAPAKTASEAALERFAGDDPDQIPGDEFFLQHFQSRLQLRASEELIGVVRNSGLTIEQARAEEKTRYLENAKAAWKSRRQAEKATALQAEALRERRQQFEQGVADGAYQRALAEALGCYRSLISQEHEMAELLIRTKREETRISTSVEDLSKLKKGLAETRDMVVAIEARISQLRCAQTELIIPLRAAYIDGKAAFAAIHEALVKKRPDRKIQIDKAADFIGLGNGNYCWPYEAAHRRLEDLPPQELFAAAEKLEHRFQTFADFASSPQLSTPARVVSVTPTVSPK